jgi:hypothetical protein
MAEKMDLESKVADLVKRMQDVSGDRDYGRSKKARADASAAYDSMMKAKVGFLKRLREIKDAAKSSDSE